MKINRKELLGTLESLNPGLSKSDLIKGGDSFIFSNGKITTFNDEISVSLEVPEGLQIEGAVKAEEFYGLLKKYRTNEVDIEVKDGELAISTKNSKAGISIIEEIDDFSEETGEPEDMERLPEDFIEALQMSGLFVAKDISSGVLCYVYAKDDYMYATDNFGILRYGLSGKISNPLLIHGKNINLLKKYEVSEYGLTEGWIHFKNEKNITFRLRTVDAEYPELDNYLDESKNSASVGIPEGLSDSLERAGVFSSDEFECPAVQLKCKSGKLLVESKGDYGWYKERFSVKSKKDFAFSIPLNSLKAALEFGSVLIICDGFVLLKNENFVQSLCLLGE